MDILYSLHEECCTGTVYNYLHENACTYVFGSYKQKAETSGHACSHQLPLQIFLSLRTLTFHNSNVVFLLSSTIVFTAKTKS